MNTVILIGRLANNPEMKYTQTGIPVTKFDLAVQIRGKEKDAPPDYFPITCWDKRAEFAVKHLSKGRRIGITGRLGTNRWEDKNGQKRKDITITADVIEFCDSPNRANQDGGEADAQMNMQQDQQW